MKSKKVPMRLCIGCNEMKPKRELIRILRTPDGNFLLDTTGKQSGRGAYLCKNQGCLTAAKNGHRLERSFSCQIDPSVYEVMEHALADALQKSADNLPEGR